MRIRAIVTTFVLLAAAAIVFVLSVAVAFAQTLPHNIPDLCALDPTCTVVPAGTSPALTGTHTTIGIRGTATVTGRLNVQTILCYPGGSITFADGSETVWTGGTFHQSDPEQWGHGLIAIDCLVRATGTKKSPAVRVVGDVKPGVQTLELATAPEGWTAGDRVAFPDTRQLRPNEIGQAYVPQWEERTIAAYSDR